MDVYNRLSLQVARVITNGYSTSFSLASRLFAPSLRPHIYAIYGLARIADEIVDGYGGSDARALLDELEAETYAALARGYSPNPLVHAFALTARRYGITRPIIQPFFTSMRADVAEPNAAPQHVGQREYERYIHGSAEVVGLMCLRVFVQGNDAQYEALREGAERLGAAYQKVNFLRDVEADHNELDRFYFPGATYATFSDRQKALIEADIAADFSIARQAVRELPRDARRAVSLSYRLYMALFAKLQAASVAELKTRRVRVSGLHKTWLLLVTLVRGGRV